MHTETQNSRHLGNFYSKSLHASPFKYSKYLGVVTTSVLDITFGISWKPCSNPLFGSQTVCVFFLEYVHLS